VNGRETVRGAREPLRRRCCVRVEAVRCVRACLLCGMERGGAKAYRLRVCAVQS
jgi:hypothetical protein